MSNIKDVSGILAKLENKLNKKKAAGTQDWKAVSEAKKKAMWRPKEGKNQIVVFTPAFAEDPFQLWGYHKGLQEVDYYSIPCDKENKNEECVVCNVVDSLKAEDWAGNKHLWMPIELKFETYIPVVDYASPATIAEGPKWFRASKSIMDHLINSMSNLEEGDLTFYDQEGPQRIIINWDKQAPPVSQYKVEFKALKDIPSADQYADWANTMKPVGDFFISKSIEENRKIVDEYFQRVASLLDENTDKAEQTGSNEDESGSAATVESKLSKFKK